MHKFVVNLITEWRKLGLPYAGETIVVAASGGADSTALVLALSDLTERKKLDLRIIVAHFNHKLRGKESDDDERFVRSLAKTCGFTFTNAKGEFKGKANLEERARNARYKFLSEVARKRKARFVLTGHTQNDQAETFLLNLIRGGGPDGLSGMKVVRELRGWGVEETGDRRLETGEEGTAFAPFLPCSFTPPLLARPLLSWAKRADTEKYCVSLNVEYRTDSMNDDRSFQRVRIRKDIIPLLAELNPNIVETLVRTAELLRFGNAEKNAAANDEISIADAKKLEKSEFYGLLRIWLAEKRGNTRGLQLKHIEAIARLVHSPKSGRVAELPGGDSVVKSGGRLAFRNNKLEN